MSRRDEVTGGSKNPATKWLEWKSDDKLFKYYDKEAKEEVEVKLPLKLLFLKQMSTVKGWDSHNDCRIYANEVSRTDKEELTVKSYKGGNLISGLWKDIKAKVDQMGGKYFRSIYFLTESGDIINIQLKGSAVSAWFDFFSDNRKALTDNWVTITGAKDGKKGSIKYSIPVFKLGDSVDDDTDKNAEEVYATLKMYIDAYAEGDTVENKEAEVEVTDTGGEDDLPF